MSHPYGTHETACASGAPAPQPAAASVNGVPLHPPGQRPDDTTLRQRACTELLRQQAQLLGYLTPQDRASDDGLISQAASQAIEALLDAEIDLPAPDGLACRRYYDAHAAQFAQGERLLARQILFAVSPGIDLARLRERAEQALIEVRALPERFATLAGKWSNCPSSLDGGQLGWLTRGDCAPEFAQALFAHTEVGVLPRLVHSRHGLHIVAVLAREAGQVAPFEQVRGTVEQALRQQAFATAVHRYLARLAGRASLVGVALDAGDPPAIQ